LALRDRTLQAQSEPCVQVGALRALAFILHLRHTS